MTRTYISDMILSIRCASGRRITFDPTSNGGSAFRTSNIDIQDDIEGHPMFKNGTCRWDAATKRAVEHPATTTTDNEVAEGNNTNAAEAETVQTQAPVEAEITEVTVSGVADAKDYLAERYGVLRTQMRSKEAIKKFADQYNVKFIGL